MSEALLKIGRIGRMQKQPDLALVFTCTPAFRGKLPPEIPHAHPFEAETADVISIKCAFGAPVEDRICVQENADRR